MDLFDVYPVFDIDIVSGNGAYLTARDGKKYLDLYGGHAVISIGHSHKKYVKNMCSQLEKIGFYSNSVKIPLQNQLANKLGKLSGYDDYSLFLCNSGAEANENALKLASFHTGRMGLISFSGGFHGRTSLAVALTDNPKAQAPSNLTSAAQILPLNNLALLEKELNKKKTAAVIIEGIQGIGGIIEPEKLDKIEQLCLKTGTVLILDEIQSGFGRTGKFFAHQYQNVKPGIISMAKGMGNGFPVGGILISPEFKASYGLLGTTFGGNYLACTAALTVLDVMEEENLITNSKELGSYLMGRIKKEVNCMVRGKGLMIGLEFDFPVNELRKNLLHQEQIFTGSSKNPNVLRILPPLSIDKKICDIFIDKLRNQIIKLQQ